MFVLHIYVCIGKDRYAGSTVLCFCYAIFEKVRPIILLLTRRNSCVDRSFNVVIHKKEEDERLHCDCNFFFLLLLVTS